MKLKKSTKNYIYLLGLSFISLLSLAKYYNDSHIIAEKVANEVDHLVSGNIKYYQEEMASHMPVSHCSEFLEKNSKLLLLNRDIRSIGVTDGHIITCSSIKLLNGISVKNRADKAGKIKLFYVAKVPYSGSMIPDDTGVIALKISYSTRYATYFALYPESLIELVDRYPEYSIYIKLFNACLNKGGVFSNSSDLPDDELFEVGFNIDVYSFFKYLIINHGFIIFFWTVAFLILVNKDSPIFDKFKINYWSVNRAIKQSQFHPYLQPVFNIDGKLIGAEVLVRWIHPTKGIIAPGDFIDDVEANGKIIEITRILMKKCVQNFKYTDFGRSNQFHLAFNVCAIQFDTNDLYEDVAWLQRALASKPIKVALEITERYEFNNALFISYINKLKDNGVIIALDDFGTGHCSMKYLINSKIDVIKIDRTFVSTITEGENTRVLDSIINLAKYNNIELLAEGVETIEQYNYLHALDINQYQGFFFEKPLPIEDFIAKYLV